MAAYNEHTTAQIVVNDDNLNIWGYKSSKIKIASVWILSMLTLGVFRLLLYWYPKLWVKCTASLCRLCVADGVLIEDAQMNVAFRPVCCLTSNAGARIAVPTSGFRMIDVGKLRHFTYKKMLYFWNTDEMKFITVESTDCDVSISCFHQLAEGGLYDNEVVKRLLFYGRNVIEVKLTSIAVLLFKEIVSPFYIFQILSVSIWFSDDYAIYAGVIVAMSVISIFLDVYQTRKQESSLRSMVHSSDTVRVIRNGDEEKQIGSDELVPGDVVLIPSHGCVMQCDAVLMNGTVIVNESMLTGESVPVTKVSLPEVDDDSSVYSIKEHSRHTLYCGTQILQTRYYTGRVVKAVVFRTSFYTLKGQLVRSIMYPKPVDFRFTKDLFKFVCFLAAIAALGFAYTIVIMIIRKASLKRIIIRALDIITITVPPALPAAMSIGILAAQMRLRKKQIFCISPSTINTCGAINTVCFDKTGTLTEDGLNFHSVRPVLQNHSSVCPVFDNEFFNLYETEMRVHGKLVEAIAACHSLTRIQENLCGDPLDLVLFNSTGWVLNEFLNTDIDEVDRYDILQPTVVQSTPGTNGYEQRTELAILRQFTFSSSLQRMTVIVHNPKDSSHNMTVYCKGAPEKIASLCCSNTVPNNYQDVINEYAQRGFRLIAVAYRKVELSFAKSQKVSRESVECDLILLGLIAMENRLKEETIGVIKQLNKAQIRTVMITGDNILTALSVAHECGIMQPKRRVYIVETDPTVTNSKDSRTPLMLKMSASVSEDSFETSSSSCIESSNFVDPSYQLAISGPTFSVICEEYPELLCRFVTVCDVYARMSPDQKQFLVNKLQDVDYTVAMCGDGANDCAALKAAHAGISLSEAEASIAAPFTSRVPDIRCVPTIIREGRAALVTSFAVFKYMAGYSLTQFITILQLYWLTCNMTDFQFLYIDLFLVALVALFFGNTPASEHLSAKPPPTKLLSLASVLSVIGQLLIAFTFQLAVFILTAIQPWFIPYTAPIGEAPEDKRSFQGSAIFCVSMFQYISLAVIYSKGYPYRRTILSNSPLCLTLALSTMVSLYITLSPPSLIFSFMKYEPIPEFGYRIFILTMAFTGVVCAYLYEKIFIQYLILTLRDRWKKKNNYMSNASAENNYEAILLAIGNSPFWIPTSSTQSALSFDQFFYSEEETSSQNEV